MSLKIAANPDLILSDQVYRESIGLVDTTSLDSRNNLISFWLSLQHKN